MSRDFQINGESMVSVKGRAGSAIAELTNLGLASDAITITPSFRHKDLTLDAWGGEVPVDMQVMLAEVSISMNLIHFDRDVLDVCLNESLGGVLTTGKMPRAGTRLGKGADSLSNTNNFIRLNIYSPVAGKPWRFFHTAMVGNPVSIPIGTSASIVQVNWRAIPYSPDPWNAGAGAGGVILWDHSLDS